MHVSPYVILLLTSSAHLNAVLKVPYNEAISQKILITGPQMPFPDLLLQEKGKEKTKGSAKNAEEDWPVCCIMPYPD